MVFSDRGGTVTSLNAMSTQKRRYELKARAEAQQATRARIAAAAAALHEEVGVARTTVADIARRAGVQRLTVYNHFPDLDALLPACTAHWLAEHPRPDLEPAFALEDPAERLRAVLTALYGWYRENAPMQRRLLGERATCPSSTRGWRGRPTRRSPTLAAGLSAGFDRPDAQRARRPRARLLDLAAPRPRRARRRRGRRADGRRGQRPCGSLPVSTTFVGRCASSLRSCDTTTFA